MWTRTGDKVHRTFGRGASTGMCHIPAQHACLIINLRCCFIYYRSYCESEPFLAIHEISHNLAFKSPQANRLLAIFVNLPIGLPYSAAFRPYHLTHHKSLGVDGLDTDLPTALEAFMLDSVLGKAFFATFQILFYALRPMMVYNLPITRIHLLNVISQVAFDYLLVRYVGVNALWYLIMSSFLAGSLHPCAGHFIAEHYVFENSKGA